MSIVENYIQQHNYLITEIKNIPYGKQYKCIIQNELITINEYNTGKILVQGKESPLKNNITNELVKTPKEEKKKSIDYEPTSYSNQTRIGIDEAGKGDYFGCLTICAAMVDKTQENALKECNVRDSKQINDSHILTLYHEWKDKIRHEVIILHPDEYNHKYQETFNLNHLLAWGHATALERILQTNFASLAISDQFAKDKKILESQLQEHGKKICLIQQPKAEKDIAVAIASIFARAYFIIEWQKMEEQYKMTFPKGANNVKETARIFIQKYGRIFLPKVAKVHFKITNEL